MSGRPRRDPNGQMPRAGASGALRPGGAPGAGSGFPIAVSDTVEGFDRIEFWVHIAELLAHALDVAVDGAVIDIDLILIGRVHQIVAALHECRTLGQGLQEQEFGDCQAYRLAVPP